MWSDFRERCYNPSKTTAIVSISLIAMIFLSGIGMYYFGLHRQYLQGMESDVGYQDGYQEGYFDGNEGYDDGYDDGFEEGYGDGYFVPPKMESPFSPTIDGQIDFDEWTGAQIQQTFDALPFSRYETPIGTNTLYAGATASAVYFGLDLGSVVTPIDDMYNPNAWLALFMSSTQAPIETIETFENDLKTNTAFFGYGLDNMTTPFTDRTRKLPLLNTTTHNVTFEEGSLITELNGQNQLEYQTHNLHLTDWNTTLTTPFVNHSDTKQIIIGEPTYTYLGSNDHKYNLTIQNELDISHMMSEFHTDTNAPYLLPDSFVLNFDLFQAVPDQPHVLSDFIDGRSHEEYVLNVTINEHTYLIEAHEQRYLNISLDESLFNEKEWTITLTWEYTYRCYGYDYGYDFGFYIGINELYFETRQPAEMCTYQEIYNLAPSITMDMIKFEIGFGTSVQNSHPHLMIEIRIPFARLTDVRDNGIFSFYLQTNLLELPFSWEYDFMPSLIFSQGTGSPLQLENYLTISPI